MMDKKEIGTLIDYLDQTAKDASSCVQFIESITERLKNGALETSDGNEFLSLRNHLLLDYLINLTQLSTDKIDGKSIQDDSCVDKLITLRVFIEKSQNIYTKMHHQIEKILSFGRDISKIQDNPLMLRPKPENLIGLDDLGSDEDDEDDEGQIKKKTPSSSKSKVYKPPKIAPVRFEGDDEDDNDEESKKKMVQKAKKRALTSSIIDELRREYDEAPQEITTGSIRQRKIEKRLENIRKFEEENFTRVTLSKREKQAMKNPMMTTSSLPNDITFFGDTSFLNEDGPSTSSFNSKKSKSKKKYKPKPKPSKKIKKRRIK
ncbi:neuroguidin [Brevipalpus obovatus]|uniref:neuroguidin n=1 Tax=Brevipalpus obovatus TaxID=246614 RepID=UPI003D9E4B36